MGPNCMFACRTSLTRLSLATSWHSRGTQRAIGHTKAAGDGEESFTIHEDWRSFRAKLVADESRDGGQTPWTIRRCEPNLHLLQQQNPALAGEDSLWAHPTATAEMGGLLIATTVAVSERLLPEELWQVVIFLTHVGPSGAQGVVLNRPTSLTMARLPLIVEATGNPSSLCHAFPTEKVYFGGRAVQERVSMMHGYSHLRGEEDLAPLPGVFVATSQPSFHKAVAAVQEGRCSPTAFRFFCGCVNWGPGQLEQELQNGVWHSAACGRATVLKQCLSLPVPLWAEVMRLMGDEYDEEARRCYPDI